MKWIFAAVVGLIMWALVSNDKAVIPALENEVEEKPEFTSTFLQETREDNVALTIAEEDLVQDAGDLAPSADVPPLGSSLCPEGVGCTLDLQENWHLKILTSRGGVSNNGFDAMAKSSNFKDAAEQLHYSRQKMEDHKTELKVKQLMQTATDRFDAELEVLGCRDNLCLLQISMPRDTRVDEVRKWLTDPELAWRSIGLSKQKTKYRWHLRIVATVNDGVVLPKRR